MPDETVIAVLDCLIPGDATGWPAAGQHGLAPRLHELLELLSADGPEQLQTVLSHLPEDFLNLPKDQQTISLRKVESSAPDAFDTVLKACYSAYYTDPGVRRIIEQKTGYEARPPQPLGYEMEPFDESLLEPVRARGPIWRKVP